MTKMRAAFEFVVAAMVAGFVGIVAACALVPMLAVLVLILFVAAAPEILIVYVLITLAIGGLP